MNSQRTEHQRILESLPWYVNDTLEPADRAGVAKHLDTCDECRREVKLLLAVQRAEQEPLEEPAQDLVGRVMERLGPSAKPAWWRTWAIPDVWWPKLALAELAVVAALVAGVFFLNRQLSHLRAEYEVLSAGRGPLIKSEARIRVAFQENVQEKDLRAALSRISGRIVSGPSAAGFYDIAVPVPEGMNLQQAAEKAAGELAAMRDIVRYAGANVGGSFP